MIPDLVNKSCSYWEQKERPTMKSRNTCASAQGPEASKVKPKQQKIPPDPTGLNKKCAARAKKVMKLYWSLNGGDIEDVLTDLFHDLLHLCDREGRLGDLREKVADAVETYERCRWETEVWSGDPAEQWHSRSQG